MIERTKLFFEHRRAFERLLIRDIEALERKAKRMGVRVAMRLNTASDLPWERLMPGIFRQFPEVEFYDYTKVVSRIAGKILPDNYQLTYSLNERSKPQDVRAMILDGVNVAVVTDLEYNKRTGYMAPIPEFVGLGNMDVACTDGDVYDTRIRKMDGSGRAIILRFKGSRKSMDESIKKGFVQCIRQNQ
jgi:hypothetical protein